MINWIKNNDRAFSVAAVLIVTILIWELLCHLFAIRAFILPAPSRIFVEFIDTPHYFLKHAWYTLLTTMAGFILAVVFGVALAIAIVHSVFLDRTLYTLLIALNAVPKVALAPLFVIWMGTGIEPKIAIALMIAIFSIVIDTVLGLRSVGADMLNLARAAKANRLQILMKIRFPIALASMFAGMKVGISFALIGAIVGEFVAGETGLGHVILLSQGMFNMPRAFAALVLLGLMGTVLFYMVEAAERLLLPWHVSQRTGKGH
ncbi:MAG: ABC transporter permease [Alphaproteobacteria bacterium]|nr:ABC transporter permease [Alphaproteobacteria bacterium]